MRETPSYTDAQYSTSVRPRKRFRTSSTRFSGILSGICFGLFVASLIGAAGLLFAGTVTGLYAVVRAGGSERILVGLGIAAAVYLCAIAGLARSGR